MNKGLKSFGIVALLCFSFYYTHQFALLMRQKDPIYQSILMDKDDHYIESVNALIDGDYVIPGIVGQKVNIEKSFQKMKNLGAYLESYLIYDQVMPTITLDKNKNKIIRQGNLKKMGVSFVVNEDNYLLAYFEEMGMDYAVLTTSNTVKMQRLGEKINDDENKYNEVEKSLNTTKENKNICFLKKMTKEFCQKKGKILVEPTVSVTNSNFVAIYSNILPGSIIYIENLDLSYLKLLIENIIYKGYQILPLSQLISESFD